MRAGRLRHRVKLQRRATRFDSLGAPSETWEEVGTAWASVEPLSGRELLSAMEAGAQVTHRVGMRWREGVLPVDRVVHRGRHLYVDSVIDPMERQRELVLMAEERVDA